MKFKIDENLPIEFAELLRATGPDAMTVIDQRMGGENDPSLMEICVREDRILGTLDLDFADIRTYPPEQSSGIMTLRVHRQDKRNLINVFRRAIPLMMKEPVKHRLWIIEETQVRIHGEGKR